MQGLVCKSSYSFKNYGEGNFVVASFVDYKTLIEDDQIYFINFLCSGKYNIKMNMNFLI